MKDGSKAAEQAADRASRRLTRWLRGDCKDTRPAVRRLLRNIKTALPRLTELYGESGDHWTYEDSIYRYYHQSFKVFHLQKATLRIVELLQSLAPPAQQGSLGTKALAKKTAKKPASLNPWFMAIVGEGTGKVFKMSDNRRWPKTTRPILEAFFHARYFLEMTLKYGKTLKHPPALLPSGWAAVLCLYNLG